MLTEEQLNEIREHLEKAQNPIFFFDNDADGLMSFILLRRFIGRGKGVAIKSFPELDENYIRRIDELNADYIFILDKPSVSKEFFEQVKQRNLPVVWIDHHDVDGGVPEGVDYYNPINSKQKSNEPVSYLAYKVTDRKQDVWLSMVGCVADNFIPDFSEEVVKQYPELLEKKAKSAFEILYESEFGKLVMMLDFSLKDRTTNVIAMINFLFKVNSPFEILKEDEKSFKIHKRYSQVNSVYLKLLEKAKRVARGSGKIVFFQYGGDLSLSSSLANEISYRFPGKVIIVTYVRGDVANVSIRGEIDVRELTLKAVEEIEGASGGGHKNATGAKMSVGDLEKFKSVFEKGVG